MTKKFIEPRLLFMISIFLQILGKKGIFLFLFLQNNAQLLNITMFCSIIKYNNVLPSSTNSVADQYLPNMTAQKWNLRIWSHEEILNGKLQFLCSALNPRRMILKQSSINSILTKFIVTTWLVSACSKCPATL